MELRRWLVLAGLGGVVQQQMGAVPRVTDLRIYPVKSCQGISLERATTSATGLSWDRMFAVVDSTGRIQTQRQRRRLATICPSLDCERGTLTLSAPNCEPLPLPLLGKDTEGCVPAVVDKGGSTAVKNMPVWQYPEAATRWLTRILAPSPGVKLKDGTELPPKTDETFRLVRFDSEAGFQRRVMDYYGGDNALPEDQVAFPDVFPLLLTTQESLEEVNRRVEGPAVSMERFRPNIVVAGAAKAFDEDNWAMVDIGEGERSLSLRCLEGDPRCQVPSIDQKTGEVSKQFEPSRTLRGFRMKPDLFGRDGDLADAGPIFGAYAAHGGKAGELRVGDFVSITERSTAPSLHQHWTKKRLAQGGFRLARM